MIKQQALIFEYPPDIKQYKVKVQHDRGIITILTAASSEHAVRNIVMEAELCPECAILSVEENTP